MYTLRNVEPLRVLSFNYSAPGPYQLFSTQTLFGSLNRILESLKESLSSWNPFWRFNSKDFAYRIYTLEPEKVWRFNSKDFPYRIYTLEPEKVLNFLRV